MLKYELFYQSVCGANHKNQKNPREDFGIKFESDEYRIFAVADGHGSKTCFRSHVGSELICKIVLEKLSGFARKIKDENLEGELLKYAADGDTAALMKFNVIRELINSIVDQWTYEVKKELSGNPITEEERLKASDYAEEYKNGERPERMYGTTLIAGLQTGKYLLLLQQGDGHCVVFDGDGNASCPIPWDDRCIGNVTTSLCDTDAKESFRLCIINLEKAPVIACIAGTDGVEDSFPMSIEQTQVYYREIIMEACDFGIQKLENNLLKDLSDLSEQGSRDDITVSGIIDLERAKTCRDSFGQINNLVNLKAKIAVLNDKIMSVENGGKHERLRMESECAKKTMLT